MKTVTAKKRYTCDITKRPIVICEKYKNISDRFLGIYRFSNECTTLEIEIFLKEKLKYHIETIMREGK